MPGDDDSRRLSRIDLEVPAAVSRSPAASHELRVALYDLTDDSRFDLGPDLPGPYVLGLHLVEDRLVFDLHDDSDNWLTTFNMGLRPFRSLIKDYFAVCDSYYSAIKSASPSQIEAIDMGRRGLHNEAASRLRDRLADRIGMDVDTARRLFTLICALHMRG